MTKVPYDVSSLSTAEEAFGRVTDRLLARDGRRAGQDYICPVHDDNRPSLGVVVRDGKVLVNCSAGCDTADVMKALGMKMADLYADPSANGKVRVEGEGERGRSEGLPSEESIARWADALAGDRYWTDKRGISRDVLSRYQIGWNKDAKSTDGSRRIGAYTFPYRDRDGALLNLKRRWMAKGEHSKTFRMDKGAATDFLWPPDQLNRQWVILVEGEPDALRAIGLGLPAVTGITGAGGAVSAAQKYAPRLSGQNVVVCFDSSATGRKAAEEVALIVANYAASVRVFDPFPGRTDDSDLSDWFQFYGDDVERFKKEIRKLPVVEAFGTFDMPDRAWIFPEGRFNAPRLGAEAEAAGHLRIGPGDSLWRYVEGVFRPGGETWLRWYCRDVLKDEFKENRLREVRAWCKAADPDRAIPEKPDMDYINCTNGLLYWNAEVPTLIAHSHEIPSIIRIGAAWDPSARCPTIRRFLKSALPADAIGFFEEWMGYLLLPTSKYQRALMLEGPSDTGKSTLIHMMESFIGRGAISHHSLQQLCDERFAKADLYGKLANIHADLDARTMQNSGAFKTITAGDMISAEFKFGSTFYFSPYARQVYSANELPGTNDQSDAYYKRWLVLPMHNKRKEADQDPDLQWNLVTKAELSGLLNLAIEGLKRLEERKHFDVPPSMRKALQGYRAHTDTVVAWAAECLRKEIGSRVRVGDAFLSYSQWCVENGKHPYGKQRFSQHAVQTLPGVFTSNVKGYPCFNNVILGSQH